MDARNLRVRPAKEADLGKVATMVGELVRFHHAIDELRFMKPQGVEDGYRHWLRRELDNPDAIILVAESNTDSIDGYVWGRIEGRNWSMLLDPHAVLHDVFVRKEARGHDVGAQLIRAFISIARERGLPRTVLHTASSNTVAQKLFAKLGFRNTMIEMTRENDDQASR